MSFPSLYFRTKRRVDFLCLQFAAAASCLWRGNSFVCDLQKWTLLLASREKSAGSPMTKHTPKHTQKSITSSLHRNKDAMLRSIVLCVTSIWLMLLHQWWIVVPSGRPNPLGIQFDQKHHHFQLRTMKQCHRMQWTMPILVSFL